LSSFDKLTTELDAAPQVGEFSQLLIELVA